MRSTYLLKLTVRLSLQFSSVPFWASAQASSTVLHIVTFVYIVGTCSGKNFALYFRLSWYLAKPTLRDKTKQSG